MPSDIELIEEFITAEGPHFTLMTDLHLEARFGHGACYRLAENWSDTHADIETLLSDLPRLVKVARGEA